MHIAEASLMALRALVATCLGTCLLAPAAFGQTAPSLPASMIAGPGQTKTNSVTSGQRSTLGVSTSSSIGTSVSISATDGYSSQSQSSLTLSTGVLSSSFGGREDRITANIGNLQSSSGSGYSSTGDGLQVNGSKDSQSTGSVAVEGINASINTTIDPTKTSLNASSSPAKGVDQGATTAAGVGNSNASASINMNNGMNVDVSNSTFSNAFSQAF
jgi:hypothetical protein